VLTQEQIQEQIERYQDALNSLVGEIREAGRKAAIAETDYEIAFAQERLRFRYDARERGEKATVDLVDDEATVRTAELRREAFLSKNNLSTLREAISAMKANLDALRTLSASNRFVP